MSGSKLLMIKAQSLAEEIADVISDLREISSVREERLIIYIEAPELFIPNERMIDLLRIPNESKAELLRAKAKIANVLREIVNRANFIAATASGAMVDAEALRGAITISIRASSTEGLDYSI
ncbi:MAG: hypothetical protein ACP5KE_09675 [Candidatus Methanodesulfokora sp.]